jgi:hypothetical protein
MGRASWRVGRTQHDEAADESSLLGRDVNRRSLPRAAAALVQTVRSEAPRSARVLVISARFSIPQVQIGTIASASCGRARSARSPHAAAPPCSRSAPAREANSSAAMAESERIAVPRMWLETLREFQAHRGQHELARRMAQQLQEDPMTLRIAAESCQS